MGHQLFPRQAHVVRFHYSSIGRTSLCFSAFSNVKVTEAVDILCYNVNITFKVKVQLSNAATSTPCCALLGEKGTYAKQ